jgi:hypothetical protein
VGPLARAQFSPDGTRAYVAYLGYDGSSWSAPLSLVDVASGRVAATALQGPGVASIHLSPGGAGLYAIDAERLVLLDPATLTALPGEASVRTAAAILAVVARR